MVLAAYLRGFRLLFDFSYFIGSYSTYVLTFVPHESPDVGGIRDLIGFPDCSSITEYFREFEHAT